MNPMTSLDPTAIAAFILNILLPLTTICLIAVIAARCVFRHNPGVRYLICLTALVCALLSPLVVGVQHKLGHGLVNILLPQRFISSHQSAASVAPTLEERPVERPYVPRAELPAPSVSTKSIARATQSPPLLPRAETAGISVSAARLSWLSEGVWIALLIWATGFTVGIVRFVHGWRLASRLNQNGRVWIAPVETCDRIERILGCPMPAIFTSPNVPSPVAVGLFRPRVILPEELAENLSPAQMRHVLLHECAHIAFRHTIGGVIERVVGLLFWLHPLIRPLCRELARAREEICDNVASQEDGVVCYVRTLFLIAQGMSAAPNRTSALALLDPSACLETRIAGLLNTRRNRMIRMQRWKLSVVACMAISTMTGTAVFRVVAAEKKQDTAGVYDHSAQRSAKLEDEAKASSRSEDPVGIFKFGGTPYRYHIDTSRRLEVQNPPDLTKSNAKLMAEVEDLRRKLRAANSKLDRVRNIGSVSKRRSKSNKRVSNTAKDREQRRAESLERQRNELLESAYSDQDMHMKKAAAEMQRALDIYRQQLSTPRKQSSDTRKQNTQRVPQDIQEVQTRIEKTLKKELAFRQTELDTKLKALSEAAAKPK